MLVEISLKNSPKKVVVNDYVYEFLQSDPHLQKIGLVENLREHSTGRAVFQKSWRQENGSYMTETIYLHKLIAENFLPPATNSKDRLIMVKNGERLDCRVENLAWSNRGAIKRNISKTTNKTGYIGVFQDRYRFVARIYLNRKPIDIGRFNTAEEAALAYNKKSIELFGETSSLNRLHQDFDNVKAGETGVESHAAFNASLLAEQARKEAIQKVANAQQMQQQ
jgi:hypothetical protein